MTFKEFWSILLPQYSNAGFEHPMNHHQAWNANVLELCGSLAILGPINRPRRGLDVELFKNDTFRASIRCDYPTIEAIANITTHHYHRKEITYIRIHDYCIFKHRE